LFRRRAAGEVLLRLTYKAYVEDEEDEGVQTEPALDYMSDEDILDYVQRDMSNGSDFVGKERETFMDLLAALLVSEEFQGIVSSETGSTRGLAQDEEAGRSETAGSAVAGATNAEGVSNSSIGEQVLPNPLLDYLGKDCLLRVLICFGWVVQILLLSGLRR
jgi:hypothetical protein